MADKLEARVILLVVDVALRASEEAVHAVAFVTAINQFIDQVRTRKARAVRSHRVFACSVGFHRRTTRWEGNVAGGGVLPIVTATVGAASDVSMPRPE